MERNRIVEIIDIRGHDVTITLIESSDGSWTTGVSVGGSTITTAPDGVANQEAARAYAIGVASNHIGGAL